MSNSGYAYGRAGRVSRLVTVVVLCLSGAFAALASAARAECPNEAVRQQQGSAALPDCRAYEKVSPDEKNGGDIDSGPGQSSGTGDAVSYVSLVPFGEPGGGALGNSYVARRTSGGWQTTAISPLQAPEYGGFITSSTFYGYSTDLSKAVYTNDDLNEPNERHDLLVEDTTTKASTLLAEVHSYYDTPHFSAASSDLSHVVFESEVPLTPDSPSTAPTNVYDSTGGSNHLVTMLEDGKPAPGGGVVGSGTYNYEGSTLHAVSEDGSHIYFTSEGQLYVRIDDSRTIHVSAAQGTSDPAGTQPAAFQAASQDGSLAYFTSTEKLTPGSTAHVASEAEPTASADLYRYDLSTGGLVDLTPDATDLSGAQVQGVLGASGSGEDVYFVARGQLVPGRGVAGEPNVYLWTPGAPLTYVTTLSSGDGELWTGHSHFFFPDPNLVVSANGVMLLDSATQLTSYENAGHREVYRFDPESGLLCVSCNPSGAPAVYDATFRGRSFLSDVTSPRGNLTIDGRRAFFVTNEALVPGDANGQQDVYEWEDGQIHLISTGQDNSESGLSSVSPDGSNVFITTRQRLAAEDIDSNADLYDARENGGFAQLSAAACTGTGCQGAPPAPPIFATPSSATFNGVGNFPAAKAKPATKAKPKSKHKAKKKAKKKPKKAKSKGSKHKQSAKGRKSNQAAARRGR